MKIQPKTDAQISAELLLPEGDYDFEIVESAEKVSKTGKDMIHVKLKIFKANGSSWSVDDYLLESMAFKLRHFMYAVGLGDEYDRGLIDARALPGRSGRVSLRIETQAGYRPKNSVKDYVVPDASKAACSAAAAPTPAPAPKPGSPDDAPF